MADPCEPALPARPGDAETVDRLWPAPEYTRQVDQLRAAVGRTIYLAELDGTAVQPGVRITDRPYTLLGLVDFPRPDPVQGLAPHLILLDDGRGVNLGRIARISTDRAFAPAPSEILFQDRAMLQALLFQERRLSHALIADRSRQLLGEVLGEPSGPRGKRLRAPRPRAAPAGEPEVLAPPLADPDPGTPIEDP